MELSVKINTLDIADNTLHAIHSIAVFITLLWCAITKLSY
jgi:hypothetical protein